MSAKDIQNVHAIKKLLEEAFPEAGIYHKEDFESESHRFQIEDPKPRLRLSVSDECMEDHTEAELIELLGRYDVVERMKNSAAGTRFVLKTSGLTVER